MQRTTALPPSPAPAPIFPTTLQTLPVLTPPATCSTITPPPPPPRPCPWGERAAIPASPRPCRTPLWGAVPAYQPAPSSNPSATSSSSGRRLHLCLASSFRLLFRVFALRYIVGDVQNKQFQFMNKFVFFCFLFFLFFEMRKKCWAKLLHPSIKGFMVAKLGVLQKCSFQCELFQAFIRANSLMILQNVEHCRKNYIKLNSRIIMHFFPYFFLYKRQKGFFFL